MKQVWQCDYCNETSLHHKIMEEHENGCVFNPINHSCHSCLYALEDNYISGTSGCEKKKLDFFNYEIYGNCGGWDHKDKSELRKLKIKKLIG